MAPRVMKVSARLKVGKVPMIGKVIEIKSITQPEWRRSIMFPIAPAVISKSG